MAHVLKISDNEIQLFTGKEDLKEMLTFANAAASIITTRKGALKVMPSVEEIEELINPAQ